MKKKWMGITVFLLAVLVLAACGGGSQSATSAQPSSAAAPAVTGTPAATSTQAATDETSAVGELELTVEELAYYDGKDGRPAYVAVDGIIYDVTDVPEWANGEHKNGLTAGNDLTEEIQQSPHGTSVLDDLPVVGRLVE